MKFLSPILFSLMALVDPVVAMRKLIAAESAATLGIGPVTELLEILQPGQANTLKTLDLIRASLLSFSNKKGRGYK